MSTSLTIYRMGTANTYDNARQTVVFVCSGNQGGEASGAAV